MHFICSLDSLRKTIAIVERAISTRTSTPILEHILVTVSDATIHFRATDLDISIEAVLESAHVVATGSALIHGKTLSTILAKCASDQVDIQLGSSGKLSIVAGSTNFELLSGSVADYPDPISATYFSDFSLSADALGHLIRQTIFSVSFDETKQFLNGVLLKGESQSITFVSTDGYRLSIREDVLPVSPSSFSTIVTYRGLNELGKIVSSLDPVSSVFFQVGEAHVQVKGAHFTLTSRIIKAQFPDFRQVIPAHSHFHYTVSRGAMLTALERASIIAAGSKNIIRLSFESHEMGIKANAPSLGQFRESLPVTCVSGEGGATMSFNVKLILDGLRHVESDDVHISFNQGVSPCIIRPAHSDQFTYVVMPIRTSDIPSD